MKYFKLDKDKREIIIDKYKKYNVNVDILDLIIDLKCENDRLNNIINELEKYMYKDYREIDKFVSGERAISALNEINRINKKLKELKDSD